MMATRFLKVYGYMVATRISNIRIEKQLLMRLFYSYFEVLLILEI